MACSSFCDVQLRQQDFSKFTRFDSKSFVDVIITEKKAIVERFRGIKGKFRTEDLFSQSTDEITRCSSNIEATSPFVKNSNTSETSSSQKHLTSSSESSLDKIVGRTTSFPVRSGFRSSFMIRDILKGRWRRETAASSFVDSTPTFTSVSVGARLTPEAMLRTTSALSTNESTESNDDDEENESDDVIDNYDDYGDETMNSLNGNQNNKHAM